MLKPIFEIGDLVSLLDKKNRKRLIRQKNYFVESTDDLGVGIIIDKLEELFVFPNGLTDQKYMDKDSKRITKKNLKSTPTNIAKVYWIKIEKARWEYEDDLQIYRPETSLNLHIIERIHIESGSAS